MDLTLLQSWLRLPAGPWPPDHYTLLNLPPATTDGAVIERHVLDRMDVLRRHQLRHPELVTTGMNQLAQALVCLSDATERAAYDAALEPKAPASPRLAELVPEPPLDLPPEVPAEPPIQAQAATAPRSSRWVYRRLAVVRRCERAWEALGPVFAHPGESLAEPSRRYGFLLAALDAQPLIPDLDGIFDDRHAKVEVALGILGNVDPVRELCRASPKTRVDLTAEWRRGRAALEDERLRLRALVPRSRPSLLAIAMGRLQRLFRQSPEALLVLPVALALLVTLVRSSVGR